MDGEEQTLKETMEMLKMAALCKPRQCYFRSCSHCYFPLVYKCINDELVLFDGGCNCVEFEAKHRFIKVASWEWVARDFLNVMKHDTEKDVKRVKKSFDLL